MKNTNLQKTSQIAAIVPTKNEVQSIGIVVNELKKYDIEILVIDGN